ncbi:MAG: non-homologous end-joining DNA ligase [Acidimicrobiia bacterium]
MTLPRYEPMLATPWPEPFDHPDWLFEVKWDGVRVIAAVDGSTVTLRSRRGLDMTGTYPELTGFRCDRPTVIDGEVVALDDEGRPSFSLLQQRMNTSGGRARTMVDRVPVTLMAFDLLHHGSSTIDLPLEERRDRLDQVLPAGMVRSDATRGEGRALHEAVVASGLEGIVAKRSGSPYRPGVRSPDWRKVVHRRSGRFVVGGYLPGEGARSSSFASLLLGLFDGDHLRFVGAAGSGFDHASLGHIRTALDQMQTPSSPFFLDGGIPRTARYVEPALVAVVEYREWTHERHLRAPVFKGFTADPGDVGTWQEEGPDAG